jgi:glycolate oxidase iron-sulfur subunit
MQTRLAEFMRATGEGIEAESILRACVHCGFCNASCPTYRLLGDERDGPRGRIYLIKQVLEGQPASHRSQRHLDRCLGCRACETACPSGVEYGRLLDIGRAVLEERVPRPLLERWQRSLLRAILPYPRRFGPLLRCAWTLGAALPRSLRRKLPPRRPVVAWPPVRHPRRMLVLDGCVQAVAAPGINAAAAQVLDRLRISLVRAPGGGCCGALSHHLAAPNEGLDFARRNIDALLEGFVRIFRKIGRHQNLCWS